MPRNFAKTSSSKTAVSHYASAGTRACVKYRRLQTMIRKIFEISEKCDSSLSLLVKDGRSNKITEYYTGDNKCKLENIVPEMESAKMQPTRQALRIVSINITDKFKKKDVDTDQIEHEEDNVLDQLEQQDIEKVIPSARNFDKESESYDDDIKQLQFDTSEITKEEVTKCPMKQPVIR